MAKTPPDTDKVRRPVPEPIDQRQHQIDPADHHTADPNQQSDKNTKQRGEAPKDDDQ